MIINSEFSLVLASIEDSRELILSSDFSNFAFVTESSFSSEAFKFKLSIFALDN